MRKMSVQEWERTFEKAFNKILERFKEAGGISLTELANMVSADAPVETGNLANSVGHFGPIRASKKKIRFPPMSVKKLTKQIREEYLEFRLPIGMEYAKHVDDRTDFTERADKEAPLTFEWYFTQAQRLLEREIEAMFE